MAHFYQHYKHLLFNEKLSDFTAVCDGERIPLHMVVVGAQSKFFEKLSENGFAESQAKEVHFPEDDLQTLRAFLTYLYTGNYDNEPYTTIMADTFDAGASAGRLDTTDIEPSIETNMTDSGLEDALNKLRIEPWEFAKGEPPPVGSIIVHHALFKAVRNGQAVSYLNIVRELIQNLYMAIDLYSMADKYMVDRLRLLARNRFFRIGLNLVTEAARRTKRGMQSPGCQEGDDIIEEIWEAIAEAIDTLYCSIPSDALMRSIPSLLLGITHVYSVMRREGVDDHDTEEPPWHEKIAALLSKYPHLKEEIDELRDNWDYVSWRRVFSIC